MYFITPPLNIVDAPADDRHTGPARHTDDIKYFILHATVGSFESSLDWLTVNPNSYVSVHRLIDRDGTIYKLMPDSFVAYHVGSSRIGNTVNLNQSSLGIELVNTNSGHDPYPYHQVLSCAKQIAEWQGLLGELPILSHASVDTKGKTDPRGFDWSLFYSLLINYKRSL